MDIPLAGLHESPIDLHYVGAGTHEGKSIFAVTVEFTPATTAANFKLHYIRVAFEKKEANLNMYVLMWGAWRTSGCSRSVCGIREY